MPLFSSLPPTPVCPLPPPHPLVFPDPYFLTAYCCTWIF